MATSDSAATRFERLVDKAYQAFFSPLRYEEKTFDRQVIERGTTYHIPYDGGELAVTRWGHGGPAVLLMHGWGGARAQMTGLVEPLLADGYRVVAYDQPGHGESAGRQTNILKIAPTMDLVRGEEGRFHAILAHSFGTLITSYALVRLNFPPPARLIYFGTFNRLMDSMPRFQAATGLPEAVIAGVEKNIYAAFGKDVLDAITNETLAPQLEIPALMFHDSSDNVTPIEDSRAVARVWKSARLFETSGLGHRGVLQSGEIHARVVQFLNGDAIR